MLNILTKMRRRRDRRRSLKTSNSGLRINVKKNTNTYSLVWIM